MMFRFLVSIFLFSQEITAFSFRHQSVYNPANGDDMDDGTKDKIAKILEGILTNLQNHPTRRNLMKIEKRSLAALRQTIEDSDTIKADQKNTVNLILKELKKDCPFGYGCGGGDTYLDEATKEKVAKILGGILTNLQGH